MATQSLPSWGNTSLLSIDQTNCPVCDGYITPAISGYHSGEEAKWLVRRCKKKKTVDCDTCLNCGTVAAIYFAHHNANRPQKGAIRGPITPLGGPRWCYIAPHGVLDTPIVTKWSPNNSPRVPSGC